VDFSAEKGYDALKNLIETDQGTRRLGEVALIGKSSPIAKSKILFYNTLFDENASCHLALGKGYPTTVKDGDKLNKEELSKLGLNDSVEHVDFMIGTEDLSVIGIEKDGTETPIFISGDWCV
jgi:aminopeptidase